MSDPHFIPNSYQTPNVLVDRVLPLLTPEEWTVLSFATRRILGWRDTIADRQAHISLSEFEKCGLSRPAIMRALDALHSYGLLRKIGKPAAGKGQLWEIAYDDGVDLDGLLQRAERKHQAARQRTRTARSVALTGQSDLPLAGQSHSPPGGQSDLHNKHIDQTQSLNTPQPHVAIIDAWTAALPGGSPILSSVYKRYARPASALAKAGITPAQVAEFTQHLSRQPFWQGKLIGLDYVAGNIRAYLAQSLTNSSGTQKAPTANEHPPFQPPFDPPKVRRPPPLDG